MKVYRIEKENGIGPYVDTEWVTREHCYPERPCPYDDGIKTPFIFDNNRCGFESLSKMKKWFNSKKELLALHKLGYRLRKFGISKNSVLIGNKQVVFNMDRATFIEEVSLKTFTKRIRTKQVTKRSSLKKSPR